MWPLKKGRRGIDTHLRREWRSMALAIKAEICDPQAEAFVLTAQKTMYGGKHIAKGDTVFVFASENEGGQGLIARGMVTSAEAIAKKRGVARQTPRVSIAAFCHPWQSSPRPIAFQACKCRTHSC